MQVWTVARRWSPLTLHFPHRWKTGVGRTGRDDRWCWRREGIIVNLNILWQLLEVTEKGNFTEKGKNVLEIEWTENTARETEGSVWEKICVWYLGCCVFALVTFGTLPAAGQVLIDPPLTRFLKQKNSLKFLTATTKSDLQMQLSWQKNKQRNNWVMYSCIHYVWRRLP